MQYFTRGSHLLSPLWIAYKEKRDWWFMRHRAHNNIGDRKSAVNWNLTKYRSSIKFLQSKNPSGYLHSASKYHGHALWKFERDSSTTMEHMGKRDFARFYVKTCFGRTGHIVTGSYSSLPCLRDCGSPSTLIDGLVNTATLTGLSCCFLIPAFTYLDLTIQHIHWKYNLGNFWSYNRCKQYNFIWITWYLLKPDVKCPIKVLFIAEE